MESSPKGSLVTTRFRDRQRAVSICLVLAAIFQITEAAMAQNPPNSMGNIYNNRGIITQGQTGNNTVIQGPIARSLDREPQLRQQMLRELPRDKDITVTGVLGDAESCDFAIQIY